MKRLALLAFLAPCTLEAAPTLSLPPSAARTAEDTSGMGTVALPLSAWRDGAITTLDAEGEVTQTAWRIDDNALTTHALIEMLGGQLQAEGFEILFECETDACGGFDFRFAIDCLPEPDMHVDMGDFRYLTARRDAGGAPDYVSLLVSRSSDSGYVQMTRVGAVLDGPLPIAAATFSPTTTAPSPESLGDQLLANGKVVLADLSFESGAKDLSPGDYASLGALAGFLKMNPEKSIALVGHTDAQGSLAANVAVSRARAASVLRHLVADYGVNAAQLSSDGVGYLSPVASNLTETGRTQNRRVEAMITSTR